LFEGLYNNIFTCLCCILFIFTPLLPFLICLYPFKYAKLLLFTCLLFLSLIYWMFFESWPLASLQPIQLSCPNFNFYSLTEVLSQNGKLVLFISPMIIPMFMSFTELKQSLLFTAMKVASSLSKLGEETSPCFTFIFSLCQWEYLYIFEKKSNIYYNFKFKCNFSEVQELGTLSLLETL
jgi:hypothetical protein